MSYINHYKYILAVINLPKIWENTTVRSSDLESIKGLLEAIWS